MGKWVGLYLFTAVVLPFAVLPAWPVVMAALFAGADTDTAVGLGAAVFAVANGFLTRWLSSEF